MLLVLLVMVPVPVVLQKGLVRVTEMKAIDQLDGFSAPRLAEYYDPDPCQVMNMRAKSLGASAPAAPISEIAAYPECVNLCLHSRFQ